MKKGCDKKEKIKKITLHRQIEGVHVSSMVNEGIRALLNFIIFFYKKISHAQKAQNVYKQTKTKKSNIFMLIKNI